MNAIEKIGLIVPDISDLLEYNLIDGIKAKTDAQGYDLIIMTGAFNSQLEFHQDEYIYGLENIYELILHAGLDGVIFAADRFHNEVVRDKIYDYIKQAEIPCVVTGHKNNFFPFVLSSQRESMKLITKHLINEHNCRKIYCVTGFPDNQESIERLNGFCDAMNEAGLEVSDDYIFYGGFWMEEPKKIAVQIAEGTIGKPDAVVCASDVMAMYLTNTLIDNGIFVPDDVCVVGYDGDIYSHLNSPSITTVYGRDFQLGRDAFDMLLSIITDTEMHEAEICQHIRYGQSCGCGLIPSKANVDSALHEHIRRTMKETIDVKMIMTSNVVQKLSSCNTLDEWVHTVDECAHTILGWKWLDICLCEDWKFDFSNPEIYRQHGFSDRMYLALSKRHGYKEPDSYHFNTNEILPALSQPHKPTAVVITSLFYSFQVFGYIATAYDKVTNMNINEFYIYWCDAICNGLGMLQKRLYSEHIKSRFEILSVHDPSTGMANLRGFLEKLPIFMSNCRKNSMESVLIMLSVIPNQHKTEQLGIDETLITANAIRMSAEEIELDARISDNIFLMAVGSNDISDIQGERLSQIHSAVNTLTGEINDFQLTGVISLSENIDNNPIEDICEKIEKMRSAIIEKADVAREYGIDYKTEIRHIRREIYLYPQKEWNTVSLAAQIGISRSHLQRIYKAEFSVSFHDDVIQARLKKAVRLLETTDMRIQEIADACGYSEFSHFIRQFKNKIGITATEYRKKAK